jgi:hypothetical protein
MDIMQFEQLPFISLNLLMHAAKRMTNTAGDIEAWRSFLRFLSTLEHADALKSRL